MKQPSSDLIIVAGGGRDLAWSVPLIARELSARANGRLVHLLLHGGARGADQSIAAAADQIGWPCRAFPAEWERHGRAAGPIRNRHMLDQALSMARNYSQDSDMPVSVLVVAFPGGAGTASLVQLAKRLKAGTDWPLSVAEIKNSTDRLMRFLSLP